MQSARKANPFKHRITVPFFSLEGMGGRELVVRGWRVSVIQNGEALGLSGTTICTVDNIVLCTWKLSGG